MLGKLLAWLRPHAVAVSIPNALWQHTIAAHPFLAALDSSELVRLRTLSEGLLASKEFTAADGLELSDAARVSIAAQGCLPILNLGLSWYRGWVGIVVYPDEFVVPRQQADEFGIVHEFDDVVAGEAWDGGPLILSWHDAQMSGEGYNVIIHEFAHKLDMLNGEADGIPPLHREMDRESWIATLDGAYEDFCRRVDSGEETSIDPYASNNPAEFFAVLSETFFELPALVHEEYPALYEQLRTFYRQDPLSRQALTPNDN
jgi:Mlc titration factor MtfA (ptsG expression regulator)